VIQEHLLPAVMHVPHERPGCIESDIIDLLNGLVDSNLKIRPKIKPEEDIEKKLSKLNSLLKKGLITQDDYDKTKSQLLETF
jgi:hypothetical protein